MQSLAKLEPTIDKHAVAIVKDGVMNKAFAEVAGDVLNRCAGYGQEVPCIYRLYEPKIYVDKMKELVDGMFADGYV